MLHYTEPSSSAQTAYAQLFDATLASDLSRTVAGLNGSFARKSVKGRDYRYFQFTDLGGKLRQIYVGPDSQRIQALVKEAKSTGPLAALAPLARGDPALMQHPTVLKLAAAYGKTPAQLLVRYNLQRGVPVLSKSGLSLEELEGAFSFRISYPDKVHLDELDAGRRFLQPPQGCSFPTVD